MNIVFFGGLIFFLTLLSLTVVTFFYGAPYVSSTKKIIDRMLALTGKVKGRKIVDLGSGDGKILTAYTNAGAEADGYEINPLLYFVSVLRIFILGGRPKAKVYLKNFWKADLSKYDIVTVYGMPYVMNKLYKKLRKEVKKKKLIVISSTFTFKEIKPKKKIKNVYLYEFPGNDNYLK